MSVNRIGREIMDAMQGKAPEAADSLIQSIRSAAAQPVQDTLNLAGHSAGAPKTLIQKVKSALYKVPVVGWLLQKAEVVLSRILKEKAGEVAKVADEAVKVADDAVQDVAEAGTDRVVYKALSFKNGKTLAINETALKQLKSDQTLQDAARALQALPEDHPAHLAGARIHSAVQALDERFLGRYLDENGALLTNAAENMQSANFARQIGGYKTMLNQVDAQIQKTLGEVAEGSVEHTHLLNASEALLERRGLLDRVIQHA